MVELDEIALINTLPLLNSIPGVAVVGEWQELHPATWSLKLKLVLQEAEASHYIPYFSEWVLIVDFTQDNWGKVQLYPALGENGISATLEHQMFNGGEHKKFSCRSGYICTQNGLDRLANSRNAQISEPTSTIERIVWHVTRAQQWLHLAAVGNLVRDGDPFELPDFKTGSEKSIDFVLAYSENNVSFQKWSEFPRSGIAELINVQGTFIVLQFLNRKRQSIYVPDWGIALKHYKNTYNAVWIRLDAVPVVNHWQAPKTFADLVAVCNQQGIDFIEELQPLWKHIGSFKPGLLLVGMPIPKKVGLDSFRYHWQALEVISPKMTKAGDKAAVLEILALNKLRSPSPIIWQSKVENWDPDELQNRGRLSTLMTNAHIVLLGAGALGSVIAEQLVRMGVIYLTIIDKEHFEAGNLVRHVLDLTHLHTNKALALAKRLNLVNPSAHVSGLDLTLPSIQKGFLEQMKEATLVIDCTADDIVLRALPFEGLSPEIPIISCSVGLDAKRLFFYADIGKNFSWQEFNVWFDPFRQEENQLAQEIELPQGAGCWHPLTPAPFNRIAGLAGMAVEFIEKIYLDRGNLPVSHCEVWPDLTLKNQ